MRAGVCCAQAAPSHMSTRCALTPILRTVHGVHRRSLPCFPGCSLLPFFVRSVGNGQDSCLCWVVVRQGCQHPCACAAAWACL